MKWFEKQLLWDESSKVFLSEQLSFCFTPRRRCLSFINFSFSRSSNLVGECREGERQKHFRWKFQFPFRWKLVEIALRRLRNNVEMCPTFVSSRKAFHFNATSWEKRKRVREKLWYKSFPWLTNAQHSPATANLYLRQKQRKKTFTKQLCAN